MDYLCWEISKIKEARSVFCWKEIKLFSKTMLGKGELSATKFIDSYSRNYSQCFGQRKE